MLPFPVEIYPFEIFTRAMPGSSLVFHNRLCFGIQGNIPQLPNKYSLVVYQLGWANQCDLESTTKSRQKNEMVVRPAFLSSVGAKLCPPSLRGAQPLVPESGCQAWCWRFLMRWHWAVLSFPRQLSRKRHGHLSYLFYLSRLYFVLGKRLTTLAEFICPETVPISG